MRWTFAPACIARDIVFAARWFRRQPGIVGLTIAGLALAIGIVTATFTLVNAVTLRGHGVAHPETVFTLGQLDSAGRFSARPWSYEAFTRLRDTSPSLDVVGSRWGSPVSMPWSAAAPAQEVPQYTRVATVSGNYFSMLGAKVALGRPLAPGDAEPGAPAVVVLSDVFWRTQFGGDRAVIGRSIWLGPDAFTVVGVADRAFTGTGTENLPACWVPLVSAPALNQVAVTGRLRPGYSRTQAESEINAIAIAAARDRGFSRPANVVDRLQPMDERSADSKQNLALVTTLMALVLALGGANVANLLLASAAGRRNEIGARLALGASRGRIVQQMLTESLLLGAIAGAAGLVVGRTLVPVFVAWLPVDPLADLSPDWRVYACASRADAATPPTKPVEASRWSSFPSVSHESSLAPRIRSARACRVSGVRATRSPTPTSIDDRRARESSASSAIR